MSKQHAIYVSHMGDDQAVVNAARMSFGVDAKQYTNAQNQSLIQFLAHGVRSKEHALKLAEIRAGAPHVMDADEALLWAKDLYEDLRHRAVHWTPFAHTAISIRMKAPIPIRTQCFKHKQGLVENEESRRYIKSKPEVFYPDFFRSAPEADVKQGSGGMHPDSDLWMGIYRSASESAVVLYENMIADGIAPEQARFILPQGVNVNWLWTGNLLAFANFYNKRSDPHAQKEIQDLAEMVKDVVAPLFPHSWAALTRHK